MKMEPSDAASISSRVSEESSDRVCRICRTDDGELRAPCKCSGSLKYIHNECLEEWLNTCERDYCELCGHVFEFEDLMHPDAPAILPLSEFILIGSQAIAYFATVIAKYLFAVVVWAGALPIIAGTALSALAYPRLPESITGEQLWVTFLHGVACLPLLFLIALCISGFSDVIFVEHHVFAQVEQLVRAGQSASQRFIRGRELDEEDDFVPEEVQQGQEDEVQQEHAPEAALDDHQHEPDDRGEDGNPGHGADGVDNGVNGLGDLRQQAVAMLNAEDEAIQEDQGVQWLRVLGLRGHWTNIISHFSLGCVIVIIGILLAFIVPIWCGRSILLSYQQRSLWPLLWDPQVLFWPEVPQYPFLVSFTDARFIVAFLLVVLLALFIAAGCNELIRRAYIVFLEYQGQAANELEATYGPFWASATWRSIVVIGKLNFMLWIKMVVQPLLAGLALDISFMPVVSIGLKARLTWIMSSPIVGLTVYWLVGISVLVIVLSLLLQLRKTLHPKLLARWLTPYDPTRSVSQLIITKPLSRQLWRALGVQIAITICTVGLIGGPILVVRWFQGLTGSWTLELRPHTFTLHDALAMLFFAYDNSLTLYLPYTGGLSWIRMLVDAALIHVCILNLIDDFREAAWYGQHVWLEFGCWLFGLEDLLSDKFLLVCDPATGAVRQLLTPEEQTPEILRQITTDQPSYAPLVRNEPTAGDAAAAAEADEWEEASGGSQDDDDTESVALSVMTVDTAESAMISEAESAFLTLASSSAPAAAEEQAATPNDMQIDAFLREIFSLKTFVESYDRICRRHRDDLMDEVQLRVQQEGLRAGLEYGNIAEERVWRRMQRVEPSQVGLIVESKPANAAHKALLRLPHSLRVILLLLISTAVADALLRAVLGLSFFVGRSVIGLLQLPQFTQNDVTAGTLGLFLTVHGLKAFFLAFSAALYSVSSWTWSGHVSSVLQFFNSTSAPLQVVGSILTSTLRLACKLGVHMHQHQHYRLPTYVSTRRALSCISSAFLFTAVIPLLLGRLVLFLLWPVGRIAVDESEFVFVWFPSQWHTPVHVLVTWLVGYTVTLTILTLANLRAFGVNALLFAKFIAECLARVRVSRITRLVIVPTTWLLIAALLACEVASYTALSAWPYQLTTIAYRIDTGEEAAWASPAQFVAVPTHGVAMCPSYDMCAQCVLTGSDSLRLNGLSIACCTCRDDISCALGGGAVEAAVNALESHQWIAGIVVRLLTLLLLLVLVAVVQFDALAAVVSSSHAYLHAMRYRIGQVVVDYHPPSDR